MIICEHEQGSDEWFMDRCGIPTASMFSCIITSTGGASTQSTAYMNQLLAEWKAQKPVDQWKGNKFVDIGKEREPESRALYEFLTDNTVTEVGLCLRNEDRTVGASPDGLVGDSGCVEFKNTKGSTLIGYQLSKKLPSTHKAQVQGQLWVTGLEWCDYLAYHPDIGHVMYHVERDEKYITQMSGRINKFIELMLKKRKQLQG